jgi:hypothetical protein
MTEAMAFRATTVSARLKTAATVVAVQMMLACAAVVGSQSPLGGTDEGIGGIGPSWLRAWTSYDSNWYVAIANEGYRQAPTTAFFPVLPSLMRVISPILELVFGFDQRTGLAVGGMIVSISAFVGALCCIYAEVRDTVGSVIADRTVIGLTLVPFALTWQTIYTESLTLLGLALLVRFVRQDRLAPAVLAGLLLGATRSVGVPIGLGLITAHAAVPFVRRRSVHWTATWSGVAAAGTSLIVLGLLGRAGGGVAAQAQFGRAQSMPWVPIWRIRSDRSRVSLRSGWVLATSARARNRWLGGSQSARCSSCT